MKRSFFLSRSRKLSSFTLVELLVVIGIIAILASVVAVSAGSAIRAANRTHAMALASQIQAGALNYYTEYSVYPIPSTATASTDVAFASNDATDWENVSWALSGNLNASTGAAVTTATVANTHSIAFLSLRKSDVDSNGIPQNPASSTTTAGQMYFNIAMDGDYDGILGDSGTASGTIPDFTQSSMPLTAKPTVGIAVWANCNTSTTTNASFWVHTY